MTRCSAITGPICAWHDNPAHPECNARLEIACSGIPRHVNLLAPAPALLEDVRRVHDLRYVNWLRQRCTVTNGVAYLDADTYITPHSVEVALHSAGAAIAAVEQAMDGAHCFSLMRPPGHHAESDRAMGFCLFNNAAIAAMAALDHVDRVAIIDWDVHHGNGTQHTFYGSDRVLYCSIHQKWVFPFSGRVDEIGTGSGWGYTINAPLAAGAGLADYSYIFSEIFVPALDRFKPDVVIVSAGQDTLHDDLLGGMMLEPRDFLILTRLISDAAGVPLALVLEGGYNISHGAAVACIFSALQSSQAREPQIMQKPATGTLEMASLLKKAHNLP